MRRITAQAAGTRKKTRGEKNLHGWPRKNEEKKINMPVARKASKWLATIGSKKCPGRTKTCFFIETRRRTSEAASAFPKGRIKTGQKRGKILSGEGETGNNVYARKKGKIRPLLNKKGIFHT